MNVLRWPLRRAREVILGGGVIAYPTEAVFGLGCDPLNPQAVARILAIKQRDAAKGFILIAADIAQLEPFMQLDETMRAALLKTWPGPVTWVVPASAGVPEYLTGGRDTLAVRVTAHPMARELCKATGLALVSTSANLSGHSPLRSPLAVRRLLGKHVDYVVPGAVGGLKKPTEIRYARTGEVLRAG
ncbi:MAG: threonylcarbamoyl-AMP synthase [Gammaproteobacteria bacterium]|nr:threonylcarbamoyl-AMP synthase [Gammaproteobacteria bacterium]MDE2462070.1 threonylcarbamoyl-AMP synthase [Gammaproteobacteria bacterium]